MSTTKIKFVLEDVKFELPSDCLKKTDWRGEAITPYISIRAKHVASIMKQYVKAKFPKVTCSVTSEVYSGGDSVNVYLSTPDGNEVDEAIIDVVNKFRFNFVNGYFNGMEDYYEYRDTNAVTTNGTKLSGGSNYVFVKNGAKFGTVADTVRMIKDYMAGKYIGGVRDLAGSIKSVMGYGITQATVDKALKLM